MQDGRLRKPYGGDSHPTARFLATEHLYHRGLTGLAMVRYERIYLLNEINSNNQQPLSGIKLESLFTE